MALWNHVTCGFNADEETNNFGTRKIVKAEQTLYASTTLAVIEAGGKVLANPHIYATTNRCGILCIAVEKSVIVFENENGLKILFNAVVNSAISCFASSDDGMFLLVSTKSGQIHFMCPAKKSLDCTRHLPVSCGEGYCCIEMFFQPMPKDTYIVLAVGQSGQVFRISWIVLESGSVEPVIEPLTNYVEKNEISAAAVYKNDPSKIVTVGAAITVWSEGEYESFTLDDDLPRFQKVVVWKDKWLVCLSDTWQLVLVCASTLCCCTVLADILVKDFRLQENHLDSDQDNLVVLTKTDSGDVNLKLVSLPAFKIRYSLKLSPFCYLLPMTQDLLYLEGIASEDDCKVIDQIHIQALLETLPEQRLDHLLRQNKFEEAKTFAVQFRQNVELVFKAQAMYYKNELQQLSLKQSENAKELLAVLNNIKDLNFVIECCLKTTTHDLCEMKNILKYGCDRLKMNEKTRTDVTAAHLHSTLYLLGTFEILNEPESGTVDMEAWLQFSKADLLQECYKQMCKGKTWKAMFIISRHIDSLRSQLSSKKVMELLEAVPSSVPTSSLLLWLHHLVPRVRTTFPEVLQSLVEWGCKKVWSLQGNQSHWPKNGVEFAEDLFSMLTGGDSSVYQYLPLSCNPKQLVILITALKEILQLREQYHIYITLDEYLQEDKHLVVNCLLRKVVHQDLAHLMNGFLEDYMRGNNLEWNKVICQHIYWLEESSASWSWYGDNNMWEMTVTTLIPCIRSFQDRIRCILLLLKTAAVPWSDTVNKIAKEALLLDHPLVTEIQIQQRLVAVRCVNKKYNFNRSLMDTNRNKFMMIRNIIKQGRTGMLEDALVVADMSNNLREEVYILCIDRLAREGKDIQILKILDNMEADTLRKCCRRIIFCKIATECPNICDSYMNILNSLCCRLAKVVSKIECEDICVKDLNNIFALKKVFGVVITLQEYASLDLRQNALRECIKSLIDELILEKYCQVFDQVKHLALLLLFSTNDGLVEAFHQAMGNNNLSLAAFMASCCIGVCGILYCPATLFLRVANPKRKTPTCGKPSTSLLRPAEMVTSRGVFFMTV